MKDNKKIAIFVSHRIDLKSMVIDNPLYVPVRCGAALDENDEVIGYQFVKLGKMLEDIRHGVEPNEAYKNNIGQYGRFDGAAKYIDPREE